MTWTWKNEVAVWLLSHPWHVFFAELFLWAALIIIVYTFVREVMSMDYLGWIGIAVWVCLIVIGIMRGTHQ